jgi:hypothetical protein
MSDLRDRLTERTTFCIEDPELGLFEGWRDPSEHWNGWSVPWLDMSACVEVAKALASKRWGPSPGELTYDGATNCWLFSGDDGYEDDEPLVFRPGFAPDNTVVWSVGGWFWVWQDWTDRALRDWADAHPDSDAAPEPSVL